jgi:hypothetical protein
MATHPILPIFLKLPGLRLGGQQVPCHGIVPKIFNNLGNLSLILRFCLLTNLTVPTRTLSMTRNLRPLIKFAPRLELQ